MNTENTETTEESTENTENIEITDNTVIQQAETVISNKPDKNALTRGFLLRMADNWLQQGELRQAIEGYLKVVDQYPDSTESQTAQAALLTIAQRYEQDGMLRLSLDVLERLEQTI